MHAHVVCVHIGVCECEGQSQSPALFLRSLCTLFFETGLFPFSLVFADYTKLLGQQAPGIHPFLPLQFWEDYNCVPHAWLLHVGSRNQMYVLMLAWQMLYCPSHVSSSG